MAWFKWDTRLHQSSKRWTFSLFFSPPPSFSELFKIPGLSPDPGLWPGGGVGWTGGAVPWRWWGLKCNPGPVTTKAWPLRAKDRPHFLNCDVIPEQTLRSDYISEDYILRLVSQTDRPLFLLIFVGRGSSTFFFFFNQGLTSTNFCLLTRLIVT